MNKENQLKRKRKFGLIFTLLLFITISGVYVAGTIYFTNHFYFNTELNGKDISLNTPLQAEFYHQASTELFYMNVRDINGDIEKITGAEIGLEHRLCTSTDVLLTEQNAFSWPLSLIRTREFDVCTISTIDEQLMHQRIDALSILNEENQIAPVSAFVTIEDNVGVIVAEVQGSMVRVEEFHLLIQEYLLDFRTDFNIADFDLLYHPELTYYAPILTEAVERVNHYLNAQITYLVGEEIVLGRERISEWITIHDDFTVTLDKDAVSDYIDELISKVNTHGTTRYLLTPTGREVSVTGGYYGWRIWRDLEFETLLDNITNGDIISREPIFFQRAMNFGPQDWGSTFLQVDLTYQHMWAFVEGVQVFDAPVVTGLPRDGRNTPEGVYFILEMLSPTVLVGASDPVTGQPIYRTPVQYWMRTTWAGHGFHDATWQPYFGGTRYRENGSHGCTNLSLSDASRLFDIIFVHMPVVVHY